MNKEYKIKVYFKKTNELIDNFYKNKLYDSIEDAKIDIAYFKNCDKRKEKYIRINNPEIEDTFFEDIAVEYKIVEKEVGDIDPFFLNDSISSKTKNLLEKIFSRKTNRRFNND